MRDQLKSAADGSDGTWIIGIGPMVSVCLNEMSLEQELSYRKQIARQLHKH